MRSRLICLLFFVAFFSAASADARDDDAITAAFKQGSGLIQPFLLLDDRASHDPRTAQGRAQILEGIRLLSRVTQANPNNWPAFWFIGKGHQALHDHVLAEEAFKRSYALKPAHPDVARELVIESICTGNTNAAVAVATKIADLNPMNAGLASNLGLAHLANGQLSQARIATERARQLAPDDKISLALLSEIAAVQNGRKPAQYCPP